MADDMLKRNVNVGFSGGEKKRNEVLQMALLQPKLAILDETDSGLDIDALKIVADGVNALRGPDFSALVITHYQRLLDHIVPDRVHVLAGGRIMRSGRAGAGARAGGAGLRGGGGGGGVNAVSGDVMQAAAEGFRARYDGLRERLGGRCGGSGSRERRRSGGSGLPGPRVEEWRYTPLRSLAEMPVRMSRVELVGAAPAGLTGLELPRDGVCGWAVSGGDVRRHRALRRRGGGGGWGGWMCRSRR
jgi:hypothetical protein